MLSADKSQLAEFGWVDLYARTHGGSQYAGSDILTFCSGRFCLYDGAHQGVKVFLQLLNTEGSLADRAVDDVGLVQTVLDLTSFRFLNRFDNVRSYGAGLRDGIRPLGPRILPRRPTTPIMSGLAMTTSKSIQPPWIFCMYSSAPA